MAIRWLRKLNVFARASYDSDIDPHSRSLHTNFFQKVEIVYRSMIGGKTFVGIFDFLIVTWLLNRVHDALNHLWRNLDASHSFGADKVGRYLLKGLLIVSAVMPLSYLLKLTVNLILRHGAALAFVAASMFFIGIVQLITESVRAKKEEIITQQLKVIPVDANDKVIGNTATLLHAMLKKQESAVSSMDISKNDKKQICYWHARQRFVFLNNQNQLVRDNDPLMLALAEAGGVKVRREVLGENNSRAVTVRI